MALMRRGPLFFPPVSFFLSFRAERDGELGEPTCAVEEPAVWSSPFTLSFRAKRDGELGEPTCAVGEPAVSAINARTFPSIFINRAGSICLNNGANGPVLPRKLAERFPPAVVEEAQALESE